MEKISSSDKFFVLKKKTNVEIKTELKPCTFIVNPKILGSWIKLALQAYLMKMTKVAQMKLPLQKWFKKSNILWQTIEKWKYVRIKDCWDCRYVYNFDSCRKFWQLIWYMGDVNNIYYKEVFGNVNISKYEKIIASAEKNWL